MPSLPETLQSLRFVFKREVQLEHDRAEVLNSPLGHAMRDEQDQEIRAGINANEQRKKRILEDYARFPPHHARHFSQLEEFQKASPFERSVFIMTKYPEGDTLLDQQLRDVIKAACNVVSACGFVPHLASDKRYHPGLWDNIEVYLLACSRGVAIVESKYKDELNPNVTMEWGWMRGMGRDVLYLVEGSFDHARADLGGLLQDRFQWDSPAADIDRAVRNWLTR
jgi:hypothetical protein